VSVHLADAAGTQGNRRVAPKAVIWFRHHSPSCVVAAGGP
jgi:hypothetical protein